VNWEITEIDALGRIGKLTINKKEMVTPNLFPVVHPYKNILSVSDLKKIGAQCVFTNAYIIYQNLQTRESVLKEGIHNYLNFDGIIHIKLKVIHKLCFLQYKSHEYTDVKVLSYH